MIPALTSIQVLLTAVILILTALLAFIGVQVIFILREVHRAARKLNGESQSTHTPFGILKQALYNSIHLRGRQEEPISKLVSGEISPDADTRISTSQYLTLLQQETGEEKAESFSHITALQERGRTSGRVFHRAGKPLA